MPNSFFQVELPPCGLISEFIQSMDAGKTSFADALFTATLFAFSTQFLHHLIPYCLINHFVKLESLQIFNFTFESSTQSMNQRQCFRRDSIRQEEAFRGAFGLARVLCAIGFVPENSQCTNKIVKPKGQMRLHYKTKDIVHSLASARGSQQDLAAQDLGFDAQGEFLCFTFPFQVEKLTNFNMKILYTLLISIFSFCHA